MLLPAIVPMFPAGSMLHTQTAPVVPALRLYWLTIHVSAAVTGSGILLLAGLASCHYPLRTAHEANPARMAWTSRLPDADVLDRVACRAAALAFPICTVRCDRRRDLGGGRAGRYYWAGGQRDDGLRRLDGARLLPARRVRPRLARAVAAVQRDRVAVMVFNLFFVNLVATGLRSYAGVG